VLFYDDRDLTALANFVDARKLTTNQVRAALNQVFTSRESASVIAFSPTTVGDEHDLDPQALRTLLARLELRGVVRALTPAFDSYQLPISADHQRVAQQLDLEQAQIWRELLNRAKVGRTWLTLNLSDAAAAAGVSVVRAREVLRRVEEDGLAELRATGVLHRYEILRRPDRETDLPALLESVRDALQGEHRRLEAVREFVLEPGCRVSHVLRYLGDADTATCGSCDLCQGKRPIAEQELQRSNWQSLADRTEIRAMASLGKAGPDPVGVARALCQISSPRSRPYRRHPAWGRLERAPYDEVLEAVVAALG
jgi:ATP-dependent DNA helicase RecQ